MAQNDLVVPASPGQARLWYLHRLYPGSSANNLNVVLTRRGPLDRDTLRAAVAALVDRHEPLRTTFREGPDGEPEQVVHPAPYGVPLAVDDLSGLDPADRDARLVALRTADARQPFELGTGPLLRLRLVTLAPDEHQLILVVQHAVVDASSIQVLTGDLASLYQDLRVGRPSRLPALRIQYADYAAWQAGQLATQGDALRRWRDVLARVPALRPLPGRPRPGDLGEGAERATVWEPAFARRLGVLGGTERATLFMTALAGWAVLLARYAGADDFAVGVPMTDRPGPELERVVGYFVDMVPIRVDLTGDPPFGVLLGRVRDAVIDAFDRRAVPFERVVDAAGVERSPQETPLFQVGLNLVPEADPTSDPGFWSDGQEYGDGSTKYDLFLTLYAESGGQHGVVVDWRVGLLPEPVAEALPARLRVLLDAAADAPSTPLSRLPLLLPGERVDLGSATLPDLPPLRPWSAPAPAAGDVLLDGEGWSAWLARSWAAAGARVFRSWTPPGGTEPVLGGPWVDVPGTSRAPLGRPLVPLAVLSPSGEPAPPGLAGELHVAGRPTGTLVRVLPDGQVEYVGPLGDRVRVDGYPVDLGAVESALLEQPEVAAAAVLVTGDGRVAAYVRPLPGTRPTGAVLRPRLVSRFSPSQVPAAIVVLADPPLRPDGTLDRRLLPAAGDQADTHEHVPPRTPAEHRLAAIWADVLGRDGVGVTDNFFALGGDSLLCLRVVTAATAAGLPITPMDVFARQTVAEIAAGLGVDGEPAGARPAAALPASVLRRIDPRPVLVAALDRPPAALPGWPVRIDGDRLYGDGALLDDRSWTALLTALGAGAPPPPPPPAPLPLPPTGAGPPLRTGAWTAVSVAAPLDESAVAGSIGGRAVDLVVAALAALLPGETVELSDVDGLIGTVDRPAGRLDREVGLALPAAGHDRLQTLRTVKEAVRAAADGAGAASGAGVAVSVLPGLPDGVRDVDDGAGPLAAPLEVRVRLGAGLTLRGLTASWPPDRLRTLVGDLVAELAELATAVGGVDARVYTPSDFPAAGLDQDQLDALLARLGRG